jgi:uncharacterized membrane protein YeaQ/YmgE (transglycosylase-associated protein family)
MLIGVIGWVVLGTIAGFIASRMVSLRGDDPRMGIGMGALGGVRRRMALQPIERKRGDIIQSKKSFVRGYRGGRRAGGLSCLAVEGGLKI